MINMTARGNPERITYTWTKNGLELTDSDRFRIDGAIANISGVERSDQGNYQVTATNEEGKSTADFVLNVQCEFENVIS